MISFVFALTDNSLLAIANIRLILWKFFANSFQNLSKLSASLLQNKMVLCYIADVTPYLADELIIKNKGRQNVLKSIPINLENILKIIPINPEMPKQLTNK